MKPHDLPPTAWTPEDAQRLRALMQQRGWDVVRLAQWTALSLRQVQALCADESEGADDAFYSEAIKRHTGLRLIDRISQAQPPV